MDLKPYEWFYKWVAGVIAPINGVVTLYLKHLITARVPLCTTQIYQVIGNHLEINRLSKQQQGAPIHCHDQYLNQLSS